MFPGREEPASPGYPIKRHYFATTHWSVVLATRDAEPDRAHQALECLCATYWYPVYACIRRLGKDHAEAEDIAQGFFERLLSNRTFQHLEPAGPGCGLICGWRCDATCRRSTCRRIATNGREAPCIFPGMPCPPANVIDARRSIAGHRSNCSIAAGRWRCLTVRCNGSRTETAVARHPELFEQLKSGILGEKDGHSHAELAQLLGMSLGSLRVTVLRLRRRFGQLCREEVAHTVDDPAAVDEELRYLMRVIRSVNPVATLHRERHRRHRRTGCVASAR